MTLVWEDRGSVGTMAGRGGVGTASGILRDTGGMGDAARSNGSCLCNAAVLIPTDLDALAGAAAAAGRCQ
jgi:hypothetical protein